MHRTDIDSLFLDTITVSYNSHTNALLLPDMVQAMHAHCQKDDGFAFQ
jgi:hypothetical protein